MENQQTEPTPLISEFIHQVKDALHAGALNTSDAILAVVRVCRMVFTEARIMPLTRELLGYSVTESLICVDAIKLLVDSSADADCYNSMPTHRMIRGFAVPILALLHQANINARTAVTQKSSFCDMAAGELELLLKQAEGTKSPYVVLEFDEEINTAFLCRTKDVRHMLQGMRHFVLLQMDHLLSELITAQAQPENLASPAA